VICRLLAQSTVTDLGAAEEWYRSLSDREPSARPMPGLIEWHLGDTFGSGLARARPRGSVDDGARRNRSRLRRPSH
jgi:hypothetical protein